MAESVVLKTQKRDSRGTKSCGHLRKKGLVPAIVYGHKEANEVITLSHDELMSAIRHGARVVDLELEKGLQKAQIRELQWDHLGKDVVHVDFKRVSIDERITVQVRIEIKGIAPGVTGGGVLEQAMHTVTVECLAIAVPDSVRVNVSELQIGGNIKVRDLVLPKDVKVLDDADAIVVQVTKPQEEAAAAAAEEAASAEPEVIGRKAAEEEEGE